MTPPTYNKEETLEWIKQYQTLDFCIIPQKFGGKEAIIKWKEYQDKKPTKEELEKWFSTPANIGILCGQVSKNLVVLDFESDKAYQDFFSKRDIREDTFSVKTNRGCHIYIRTDKPIKTTQIPGIVDVISDGHLVTAPPSIHPKGTKYIPITKKRVIVTVTKEDFDNTFWKKAESLGYYQRKGIQTEYGNIKQLPDEIPPCIQTLLKGVNGGERNNVGFVIATYLKNQGKSKEEINSYLVNWNKKNNPPLDNKDILSIIKSVLKSDYGIGCNNPHLQKNCTSKDGECIFQDVGYLVKENTSKVRVMYPKVDTDTVRYRIFVMGKSFEMTSDKMLTPMVFKQRWLEKHKKLLNLGVKKWRKLVNYWMDIAEPWEEDEISTEQDIVDRIISEIGSCDITTRKEDCINEKRFLYVENLPSEEGEVVPLYYPNSNVKEIISSTGFKIELRRLRDLLTKYLLDNTKGLRIGRRVERFWVFDSSKFQIDWKTQVVKDEDLDVRIIKPENPPEKESSEKSESEENP